MIAGLILILVASAVILIFTQYALEDNLDDVDEKEWKERESAYRIIFNAVENVEVVNKENVRKEIIKQNGFKFNRNILDNYLDEYIEE